MAVCQCWCSSYVFKLMKSDYQNISFIQNLRHLTSFYLFFFFQKTMKTIFMLCFNLFLLHMYSELVSSVCLIHCYSFWQFLNIFKLEAFNSRNIQECLIDLLNVNIKLSLGCFASVPQTSSSPTASQFFFVSQKMICPN